jgi:hypothetical protein
MATASAANHTPAPTPPAGPSGRTHQHPGSGVQSGSPSGHSSTTIFWLISSQSPSPPSPPSGQHSASLPPAPPSQLEASAHDGSGGDPTSGAATAAAEANSTAARPSDATAAPLPYRFLMTISHTHEVHAPCLTLSGWSARVAARYRDEGDPGRRESRLSRGRQSHGESGDRPRPLARPYSWSRY